MQSFIELIKLPDLLPYQLNFIFLDKGDVGARRTWNENVAPSVEVEGSDEINIPVFMTEYDVVACEDFKLEKDRWMRLMPEEIRKANPRFVPS